MRKFYFNSYSIKFSFMNVPILLATFGKYKKHLFSKLCFYIITLLSVLCFSLSFLSDLGLDRHLGRSSQEDEIIFILELEWKIFIIAEL